MKQNRRPDYGKTVAILPVHVYGNVCNIEEIQRIADSHSLKVIYDAAHAFGVKYKGRGLEAMAMLPYSVFMQRKCSIPLRAGQ